MEIKDKKITTSDEGRKIVSGEDSHFFKVNEAEWKQFVLSHVKEEIQKEIKYDKASLFTVFGIFASIVTFVSVEIQILKTLCDFWDVIGFSIVMLASLLAFILILDYIGRGWRNDFNSEMKQFPWILMIFIMLLFATGFISIGFSSKEIACKDDAIFRKYGSSFSDKQYELEKSCRSKIQYLQNGVDSNQKEIERFKNAKDLR